MLPAARAKLKRLTCRADPVALFSVDCCAGISPSAMLAVSCCRPVLTYSYHRDVFCSSFLFSPSFSSFLLFFFQTSTLDIFRPAPAAVFKQSKPPPINHHLPQRSRTAVGTEVGVCSLIDGGLSSTMSRGSESLRLFVRTCDSTEILNTRDGPLKR